MMNKKIIVVCSAPNGRRRGGIMHPPGRTAYSAGALTEEQLRAIRSDAVFTVYEEADKPEDAYEAALAALALLRPFLKVPEAEAQTAISELLHGGSAELPVAAPDPPSDPVVESNKMSRHGRMAGVKK